MEVREHHRIRNVYLIKRGGREVLVTKNLAPGYRVYGEELIKVKGEEYRVWDPFRSKLAAAIIKEMDMSFIKPGVKVLYLGASTGTTVSHVSDIIGSNGRIYAVEIASRVMREFIDRVVSFRRNVYPLFEDARHPEKYCEIVGEVDVVYCDVAQPDETQIAIENCRLMLRKRGFLALAIKARSINAVKSPREIYEREVGKLVDSGFKVKDILNLDPFDKDHAMVTCMKKD